MEKKRVKKQQHKQEKIDNILQQSPPSMHARSEVGYLESLNILDLIHELKSHQVGLELQNDEIRFLQHAMTDLQQEVKQLYDYAPCGYITLDHDGSIMNANLMALQLLQMNQEVLLHSGFNRFIISKWKNSYQKTLQKAIDTGKKQRVKLQLQNKAGKHIWVLLEIEADFKDAEEIPHIRLVILDITKQKLAEKNLQESEQRYRTLFDNSPVGLNVFTPDGQMIDANKASCEMHGYTKDEILSLGPKDIFSQDFVSKFTGFLATPGKGNYFHAFAENTKNDGTEFPVEVTGLKFSMSGEQRFLGIIQDISERVRVKYELEKSHEKFQSLFRQLPVGVLIVDMDGTILDFNCETMISGIPREELLGKKFSSLNLSCKHSLSKIFDDVVHGDTTSFECETRRSSGETHVLEVHPEVISYDDTSKILFTLLDITKRKHSENIIEQKTEQLHSLTKHLQSVREEEKAYIAREIHDEFGQVLSALNMNLSSIEQEIGNVKEEINRERIIEELNESKEIIKEAIRDVSKMITELRPPELDMLGIIPAIKRQITEFEKNSEITTEFISEVENIELDETYSIALFRIIQEALTNVVKHAKARSVKIVIGKTDHHINLSISDDGNGFDPKIREQKKSFGLLGIEERVILLDGKIKIKSNTGQGTEILVKMPSPG